MTNFRLQRIIELLYFLFGAITATIFLIVIVLCVPIYIFRLVVILLAKLFRPDLGGILNASSSIFVNELFLKTPPRSNIVLCLTPIANVTEEEVRKDIWDNWIRGIDKRNGKLLYPKFQQYPVPWLGFVFYKHAFDKFSLNDHIHFHKEFGHNSPTKEEDIINLTERLLNTPFQPETSPWEVHIVPNYVNPALSTATEMCAILIKVHHSLADGYSMLKAITGICGYSLENMKMPTPKLPKRNFWDKVKFVLSGPFFAFYELSRISSHILRPTPWNISDDRKAWFQHVAKSELIPVQKIVDIKDKFGVTFTSVLVSAISAAIHKNLDKDCKRKEKVFSNMLNGNMLCFSALPIPGHNETLTNHATGNIFEMPTSEFANPLERLHLCESILEKSRSSVIPYLILYMSKAMGSLFSPLTLAISKNRTLSTGLTNFPGLPETIYYCGKKGIMADFVVGGLQGNMGVAVMILRYAENIRITASSEQAIMSREELSDFVKTISDEIGILHETRTDLKPN